MLILISGSKSGLGTISDNRAEKPLFYICFLRFFGQVPLRYSVFLTTPKVPGNQKLLERMCYMLKLKVTKVQLPKPDGF